MFELDSRVELVIDRLERNGYEAYVVGGCVRDYISDRPINDWDMTTNALPDDIIKAFSDKKTVMTGARFGMVTVIIDSLPIEITTFRAEQGYSDMRHPDRVIFSDKLEDDLCRRDLTVNSMAFSPKRGIVDLFGGCDDIKNKIIRAVGEAEKRFSEDPLRIMRALRFASVLGFEIEEKTKEAIMSNAHLLSAVSAERIFTELKKLLCGVGAGEVLVKYARALYPILPELEAMNGFEQHNYHHIYDVITHTAKVVDNTPPEPHLRLCALFHDMGKPHCFSIDANGVGHFYGHAGISAQMADEVLRRLKSDNKTRESVVSLVKRHDTPIEADKKSVSKYISKLGKQGFYNLVALMRADCLGLAPQFHKRLEHYKRLEQIADEASDAEISPIKALAINGNDLIELGYKGKEIGNALKELSEAVLSEKVENEKSKLIEYLKR